MSIDTQVFLEVALSGFMAVWVYRWTVKSTNKMAEFEWLGLSVFWGLVILGTFNSLPRTDIQMEQLQKIFQNPLSVGAGLSLIGALMGLIVGDLKVFADKTGPKIKRYFHSKHSKNLSK